MALLSTRAAYFCREALKNLRFSPFLALVSTSTIAVSLILVGLFGYTLLHGYQILDEVGRELRISVYLKPTTTKEQADVVANEVKARPDVASVTVLSAELDRERNRQLLSDDLIAGLDETAIPGSPVLDITLTNDKREQEDFDALQNWLQSLQSVDGVDDIEFAADKFRLVYSIIDIIEMVGLIICGVILFAAIFFTFSTIKLAVLARREEIEVLRLVGATDQFIRTPFYLEGLVQGVLGSFVAVCIVWVIHLRIRRFVQVEQAINVDINLLGSGMITWFVVGGITLGLLGSALSIGRHLRI
ncbi:MAG: ABC transporter permease [Myxococcales bacterium]|nr:ABC transporter permease [Myxococcales bacterium]